MRLWRCGAAGSRREAAPERERLTEHSYLTVLRRLALTRLELAESREEAAELRDQLRRLRQGDQDASGAPTRR